MKKEAVSIKVERLTKRFKDPSGGRTVTAVDDVSFTIEPGELVTLLGPSGCGKTTTLRMIAGFELPTAGKVHIGDDDVTQLPAHARDKATVFQSYGLFPHMNVFENVAYGLRIKKLPKPEIETKVRDTLRLVGLEDLAARSPGRLSGGQQQRVALARSLIVEPSVLLLDEPLSNLDALLREQMRVEIRRIQKAIGITAVYVTHDRTEAMSLSDRVIVMKDGVIMQMGTAADIYENPQSKFVAGFVGKVAFFPVEILGPDCAGYACTLLGKRFTVPQGVAGIEPGSKAYVMTRPESLRLGEPGSGFLDGRVAVNIYLGSSVETFISTEFGDILVQIDDPTSKRVWPEGSPVSLHFEPRLVRVLPGD
jgi:iron(III) transport system ATP-binding protein